MNDFPSRTAKRRKIAELLDREKEMDDEQSTPEGSQPIASQEASQLLSEDILSNTESDIETEIEDELPEQPPPTLASFSRAITPPSRQRPSRGPKCAEDPVKEEKGATAKSPPGHSSRFLQSPFQLTHIRDLSAKSNVDTVKLRDILGDPLIRECWQFNYLFNLDFLMNSFDEDVRGIVQVKVIHGSWRKDDPYRVRLEESSQRYPNLQLIAAHMPEAFGTHHSKMMILLRHDGYAQVVIHTANMISQDWTNLTQAVFRTPLLPLLPDTNSPAQQLDLPPIGSGGRFKVDLLNYLGAYQSRTRDLRDQLKKYDFSKVRAALVASVPSRLSKNSIAPKSSTRWGWQGLCDVLKTVPKRVNNHADGQNSSIVIQVSSIATLPTTWIDSFFAKVATTAPSEALSPTMFKQPTIKVIFPTAEEIRRSLDGYQSGGSIHMKLQSTAQQKQLNHLKPHLYHWAGDMISPLANPRSDILSKREAYRRCAAPHIKTYIRFSSPKQDEIEWVLVTSANLSQQAWGAGFASKDTEVRVCSYEIGVCFWPALFEDSLNGGRTRMVPVFGKDTPEEVEGEHKGTVVGVRMPYDLPLEPYGKEEVPWCATANHSEPDWKGQVMVGYSMKA